MLATYRRSCVSQTTYRRAIDIALRPELPEYRTILAFGRTRGADTMTLPIKTDPVPLSADDDGRVRVGGTRVTLDTVIGAFNQGESPEEIVDGFDALELADVYTVIGYYLRHRPEVDAYSKRRDDEAEVLRREIEAQPGYQEFRERLLARRAASRAARE